MADYPITLSVPEDLYLRAAALASGTDQSLEQFFLASLQHILDDAPALLSPAEASEMAALTHLSDDALWTIAREVTPSDVTRQMQTLMDRNTQGIITTAEYATLEALVERGQRLTLRKAEALRLLGQRGHPISHHNLPRPINDFDD